MAEKGQPTAEALKQKRKREKEAARNAVLDVEKFMVEVAGIFKSDLKKSWPPTASTTSRTFTSGY